MASLAYFIRTCLAEDKYGTEFVDHLDDRLRTLNYAQLRDMQDALGGSVADAKSAPWRKANQRILDQVNVFIVPRREEMELNQAKKDAVKRKAKAKRINELAKLKEKDNVLQQIREKAEAAALTDIKEAEFKRQANEKARMLAEVPVAEDRRLKYIKCGAAYLVLVVVAAAVVLTDPLLIAAGVVAAVLGAAVIFYKAYKVGQINQIVVSEEDLAHQRNVRKEELVQKALNGIKMKEVEFNNKQAADAEERRLRRLQKKQQVLVVAAGEGEGEGGTVITPAEPSGAADKLEEPQSDVKIDVTASSSLPPQAAEPKCPITETEEQRAWKIRELV